MEARSKIQKEDLKPENIVFHIVLSLLTFMLWNFYWQYKQMKTVNLLLNKEVFSFPKWLFLTVITFGIYHAYHEYIMGNMIVEVQRKYGIPENQGLPALSIILTLFSIGLLADAIQQKELNKIIEAVKRR